MAEVQDDGTHMVDVGRAVVDLLDGQATSAEQRIRELTGQTRPTAIENMLNNFGYGFLQSKKPEQALKVFELNTRVFPEAWNTWDSLAEAHMTLGHDAEAIRFYERSLELNKDNSNAKERIAKIKGKQGQQ
jgi:Tfp pilus assembly protein PilF